MRINAGADQQATGDWAEFDTQKNIVTLGGKAKLIRGRQVVRGPKLIIDLNTGVSRMLTPGSKPKPAAGPPTNFAPGPGQLPNPAYRPDMPKLSGTPTAKTECPPGTHVHAAHSATEATKMKKKNQTRNSPPTDQRRQPTHLQLVDHQRTPPLTARQANSVNNSPPLY